MPHALPTFAGKQALIADDSKTVRAHVRSILENMGISVTETSDGAACWEKAITTNWDLIISDIDMPKLDGINLCRRLKQDIRTQTIPVILFSSFEEDREVEAGFKAGALAYVSKTEVAELEPTIRALLDSKGQLRGRKALVVDDSKVVRTIVAEELEWVGFEVETAENGQMALNSLDSGFYPDIIISDLMMPVVDGWELMSQLSHSIKYATIPVIVMSSNTGRPSMQRAINAGAASFISKPFAPGQITIHVEKILSDQFRMLREIRQHLESEQLLILAAMGSLSNALEARDQYTRGHSDAVADMAVSIGKKLGLSTETLNRLELAGLLHDIGKIGIRDAVLLKPARLTSAEFDEVKAHTVIAEKILSPIPSIHDLSQAAGSHHEKWDGTGYPQGLIGEAIPLFARIIAVADVYDALTSDRPYRQAMSNEAARQIILAESGKHFDPVIASAFLSLKL